MTAVRKTHNSDFKKKVALEAIRQEKQCRLGKIFSLPNIQPTISLQIKIKSDTL